MIDRCHYNFFSRVFPENKFINVLINSKMHNIWCESLAILPLTCFLGVWYNIGVENIRELLFLHTDIRLKLKSMKRKSRLKIISPLMKFVKKFALFLQNRE